MRIRRSWVAVLVVLVLAAGTVPGWAQAQKGYGDTWDGVWIWGTRPADTPAVEVDLARWLVERPGGWGRALVHRVIGSAAVAGLTGVYWHLEDEHGRSLYPSERSDQVLRWSNWGADFGEVDYPRIAAEVAQRGHLPLTLIARSPEVAAEAARRYPDLAIVMAGELNRRSLLDAVSLHPQRAAERWLAKGPHQFRRRVEVGGRAEDVRLTITAQQRYTLFVDDELIGRDSDWWRGETYDLTDYFTPGEHVVRVAVEPGDDLAGLLVNLRWRDAHGEHHVATDLTWECRAGADGAWRQPAAVGFEGVGPRFRLKAPWLHPRGSLTRKGRWGAERIEGVRAQAIGGSGDAANLVDGSRANDSSWRSDQLPATITFALSQPVAIREVRLHAGLLEEPGAARDTGVPTAYRLQYAAGDEWRDLVPPVRDETRAGTRYHAFSPRRVDRVRLVIEKGVGAAGGEVEPADGGRVVLREVELIKAYGE